MEKGIKIETGIKKRRLMRNGRTISEEATFSFQEESSSIKDVFLVTKEALTSNDSSCSSI